METNQSTAINNQPVVGIKCSKMVKHFLPGDVFIMFSAEFLDADKCRDALLQLMHGWKSTCPRCCADIESPSFWEGKRTRCPACGKFFTAVTGTFINGTHFDFRTVFCLALFLEAGLSHKIIAQLLQISPETVRLWKMKFDAFKTIKKNDAGQ